MDRIKVKPVVKSYKQSRQRKPSIKITVSADTPDFCHSPARSPSPQTVVKRIMINTEKRRDHDFTNCFEDEAFTQITVDDSVMDFPNCVDFGIKDFLCCKDEIDLELSSDTDTSYIEATPPHRFSDSELENQIEIMSITLDNALNLPRRTNFSSPMSKDDLFTFDLIRFESQTGIRDFDQDPESFQARIQPKLKHYSDSTTTKSHSDPTPTNTNLTSQTDSNSNANSTNNNKRLPPPPRPFRRHISLPASIFMTYLMAEQNKKNQEQSSKNDINRFVPSRSRKLTRIDGSYSSNDGSTDGSPNDENDGHTVHGGDGVGRDAYGDSSSMSSSRDTPLFSPQSESQSGSEVGLNKNDMLLLDGGSNLDGEEAFTSEIERKSLVIRYMRKLIRQDTSGNFAPPDYCI